ncbi:MAG: dockerin type I domain-containing protein [Phycisphaerae bacterium]
MHRNATTVILLTSAILTAGALAGPYSSGLGDADNAYDAPVPGWVGPDGIGRADTDQNLAPNNYVNPAFVGWAGRVVDYSPAPGVSTDDQQQHYDWTDTRKALGPATGVVTDVVSLGDLYDPADADSYDADPADTSDDMGFIGFDSPGSITLGFSRPIRNGVGADLAVFENSLYDAYYGHVFAELAYVEVSTDGVNFARFAADSLTPGPVGPYGSIDPTNVHNLAGKHANGQVTINKETYNASWGTPFDLQELSDAEAVADGLVDLQQINFVRLVDIPGSGDFADADGDPVYDAWTTYASGGFDLDAVGALHGVLNGDANCDGVVNLLDLAVVSTWWGRTDATWQTGDFTGDGLVGRADLEILNAHYGLRASSPEELEAMISVPEPATMLVLMMGGAILLPGRRG